MWWQIFNQLHLLGLKISKPLMLLWKSWGKMPLGASWWNTQRRNCLATPATLPGISILQNRTDTSTLWQAQREGFKVSYLSACPEKLPLDANLKEIHELWMSPKSGLWHFIEQWSAVWTVGGAALPHTCPQTAWCRAASEQPNQDWGGWTSRGL